MKGLLDILFIKNEHEGAGAVCHWKFAFDRSNGHIRTTYQLFLTKLTRWNQFMKPFLIATALKLFLLAKEKSLSTSK